MKVDGSLLVADPSDAALAAKRLEALGYHGGFTFEGPHDPFLPLAVAAHATERLELATAVAIAFARNPMLLANLGYDLQLQSGGRFILGLGSQIRPHIERRYSAVWSKPAARMRELVSAIRAIWDAWETGSKLAFEGEFYRHTLMTPFFDPGPNPSGPPRIFLAPENRSRAALAPGVTRLRLANSRPRASAARIASTTIPGSTSNGSLWMVSPSAVERMATLSSVSGAG